MRNLLLLVMRIFALAFVLITSSEAQEKDLPEPTQSKTGITQDDVDFVLHDLGYASDGWKQRGFELYSRDLYYDDDNLLEITKADLNSDGRPDYILGTSGPGLQGSAGGDFKVYMSSGDGHSIVANWLAHSVKVGDATTNGVRNLILDDRVRFVWNGKEYDRDRVLHGFSPNSSGGWYEVRRLGSGSSGPNLSYGSQVFEFGEIVTQANALLGDQSEEYYEIMGGDGPGAGKFERGSFVGSVCVAHRCDDIAAFVVADAKRERVYLAWKPYQRDIVVRPEVSQWPKEHRRKLADWARSWFP